MANKGHYGEYSGNAKWSKVKQRGLYKPQPNTNTNTNLNKTKNGKIY